MALPTTLFFAGNREYGIDSIKFDLVISESHNFNNIVSEHDVEDGSRISDHIKNNLETGNLTGLISNFSLNVGFLVSNRAQDAFDELIRLWKKRIPVTMVTVMRVYENVAIMDVMVDRSSDTGEAIALNVSFQQIKTVKLKEVQIDVGVRIRDTKSDQNRQSSPRAEIGRTVGVS